MTTHLFLRARVEAKSTDGTNVLAPRNVALRLLVSVEVTLRHAVVVTYVTAVQLDT